MTNKNLARWIAPVIALLLFSAAAWILHRELVNVHVEDVHTALRSIGWHPVLLAIALTVTSYLVLGGYDFLALRYVGKPLPIPKTWMTSFIAYAVGHNFGLAILSGGSVRYRIYSGLGLSAMEVGQIIAFCSFTFFLGVGTVLGVVGWIESERVSEIAHVPTTLVEAVATGLLVAVTTYVLLACVRRTPVSFRNWSVNMPRPTLVSAQIVLATIDLLVAASVLFTLLPAASTVSYPVFLTIYIMAIVLGVLSNIPGGLGVFETVVVLAVPGVPADQLLGAVLAYRLIYYLLPLMLAVLIFTGHELYTLRVVVGRITGRTVDIFSALFPATLSVGVFATGAVLLISGALPALPERTQELHQLLPLPLVEFSHLIASITGFGLLVLSAGLYKRLRSAWHLTLLLLILGIMMSLLKGLDYEEATLASLVLIAAVCSRKEFRRRSSIQNLRLTRGWMFSVALALGASLWLGLFSYKHVEYRSELWWHFAFASDAPRFLRATVAVMVCALGIGVWKLLQPSRPAPRLPSHADLDRAETIIQRSSSVEANVALTGDKNLLFSDSGDAFIMYSVRGPSWVAMGDPVGPEESWGDLLWSFIEEIDSHGGRPVFYQVDGDSLPHYLDMGLTAIKIGEEARVPLADFTLEGSARAEFRQAKRRAEREGCSFEVIDPPSTRLNMDALKAISEDWLSRKQAAEKGFSVGFFSPAYLGRFSCALVHCHGQIVAFANIMKTATRDELSIDLMRYSHEAPRGVMDYLFVELMLWGHAQGYGYFSLGMAPLSGLEAHPLGPLWHRIGNLVFKQSEHFYNFEGLRHYKEKFSPVWHGKYLVGRGGLSMPRNLADVSLVISGGVKGVFRR